MTAARERIRAFLSAHVPDEQAVEDVLLCLQEAMKNSLRFSLRETTIDVDLEVPDHTIKARVKDSGEGFAEPPDVEPLQAPDPLSMSGRGLFLMSRLSDQFELRTDDGVEVRLLRRWREPQR